MREWLERLGALTGRPLRTTMLPAGVVLAQARTLNALQRLLPVRLPVNYEGAYYTSRFDRWDEWDDSATTEEFGILRPDLDRTFADTVRWLYEQGHLSAKRAGRLAEPVSEGDSAPAG